MWKINLKKFKKDRVKLILVSILTMTWAGTSILFISVAISSFQKPLVAQASDSGASRLASASVNVGRDTQNLISKIEETGLYPIPVSNVVRSFFSVEGKILTMDKDNISVFEYKSVAAAMSEVTLFRESASTRAGAWKNGVHLYAQDNLIVFYMGERKTIINSLNSIFGQAMAV